MIPNLIPLIEPLTRRFAAAWEKCKHAHDDGEFNARVCAVLHYELGLTDVGRNGKRGDPKNLSKDIINWRGEGPNPDPVTGGDGTIIDFIVSHESAGAKISQFYPDPNGPGAWVKPLTLAQIDAGGGAPAPVPVPPPVVPVVPGRDEALDEINWLDNFYKAPDGLQRPDGLSLHGKPDFLGIAAWYLDVYQQARVNGKSRTEARAAYVNQIKGSDEWKAKHP
jgi:hypothetical protein